MRKPLLLLLCSASCGVGAWSLQRSPDIANFLNARAAWDPMCLYNFADPAINDGAVVENSVPDDACPFESLQPDSELVTSMNAASTFWQLGVHLAEDPHNDTKRVQLSSISSVSARDFFTMAAVPNETASKSGVTFEMVIRRRATTNRSMTLFSIANEYDNCADSGFRLDVNEHQVLAFVYFLPVLEEGGQAGVEACWEQRLFSVDNSAACRLPPLLEPVERTPPVQITVTLDPSSERGLWKTDFYMSYTDVETMQRVDCEVHDKQHPPNTQLLHKLIQGRYKLYLGNSPRKVASPRKRKRLAVAREFQPLGNTSNSNATERLRGMLKQKLISITGPRLPEAMRIFGDNSLSLHILGITFPPLNEDTPLAYLRSKFAEFKEQYGDQLVDYLVNLVQRKAKGPVVAHRSQGAGGQSSNDSGEFSRTMLFQAAGGATFDLFHFAIYRRVVSEEQVASTSRQELVPSRQFQSLQQTARIPEDSLLLLNLTMLHGVFGDLRLELRDVPEFGQLLLFPNKTVVTRDNIDVFRDLPLQYQRSIFFRPEADQNNGNLPLPNPVAFSRRLQPYATVRFGIADSFAGRSINKSMEAKIDIFVDAVNDAPRPRLSDVEIRVEVGVPVFLGLEGDDIDGAPPALTSETGASDPIDLLSSFTFMNETTVTGSLQLLRIVRMPQFGRLYNCNASYGQLGFPGNQDLDKLQTARVYRNSTDVANATYSTNLTYVYHGWGHDDHTTNRSTGFVVDELWYELSDGDPGVFSDVAVVKFVCVSRTDNSVKHNVLAVVRLEEDSLQQLNLAALDPLGAFFGAKTRFEVTVLPHHGSLFQYMYKSGGDSSTIDINAASNISLLFVGARITAPNTIVVDARGRIVYVPKPDYFNWNPQSPFERSSDDDYFEYQVLHSTPTMNDSPMVYGKSPAAHLFNGLTSRRVELEVANVPDALVVLPPFAFTTNLSSGDAVPTPVMFMDPDSLNPGDMYQVNLQAEDGIAAFELGFAINDNDVMSGCPFERPCTLLRSTNGTHLNISSSSTRDFELKFHIMTQLYDSSHIQVTGTKAAISTALSALTFRYLSGISPGIPHKSEFTLWVKRVDDGGEGIDADTKQLEISFTVDFQSGDQSGSVSADQLSLVLKSHLERYITTLLVLIAGWVVLSNASCLSVGFCCCCKARKKRRQKFEQQQQLFRTQSAQNDDEYSVLLMGLADILLEPNLLASLCVLESCVTSNYRRKQTEALTQAFVLRNLLPLLESERQGTRFVFQLMVSEYSEGMATMRGAASFFQRQEFLTQGSAAGKTLAYFCRGVGSKWLSTLLAPGGDAMALYVGDTISEVETLFDKLTTQVGLLPVEIVILCRSCAKLIRRDEERENHNLNLDAVHLVFFNHFLGPALLFPRESVFGFTPSTEQQNTLRDMAYQIVEFTVQWNNCGETKADDLRSRSCSTDSWLGAFSAETRRVATCRHKYEAVLGTISQASTITSSYEPNEAKADVDCELMGMCLMNIHSLLDTKFPEFNRLLHTKTSTNVVQAENTITRVRRLLKALGWPLASIRELVEYARPELVDDQLLWNGYSFHEWHDRAQTQRSAPNNQSSERSQSRLTQQFSDDDAILEQDDTSPHDVDWLSK